MRYRGNRVKPYDHVSGSGLLGKVIGPTFRGQWFRVIDAKYDAESDITTTAMEEILPPEHALKLSQERDAQ